MAVLMRFITKDDPLFSEAATLRHEVLHRPLGLSASDLDDDDPASRHLVAVEKGAVIGYARLVLSDRAARIRHVAIEPSQRRRGLGKTMVTELIAEARRQGKTLVWVNARFTALGFWRRLGFREAGGLEQAEDTHLPHKRMERPIDP